MTVPLPAPDKERPAARTRCSVNRSGITTTEAVKTRLEPVPKRISVQGLFADCIYVGSGDPVRVLHLLHDKYTGYS